MRATVPTSKRGVAAADLVAALDEHDAEPAVAAEARLDQRAVPLLEDVQRQHGVREQHGAEREHRQRLAPSGHRTERGGSVGARSQARGRRARPARRPRRAASAPTRRTRAPPPRTARAARAARPGRRARLSEIPGMRRRSRVDPHHRRADRAAGTCAGGWRASARTIARGPTGIRNCAAEPRVGVRLREQRRAAGEVEARARRGTGSNHSPAPPPTRKWPGIPTPCSGSPQRRPTSIITTLSVIGMPRWRSSTSSRNELRGSP